MDKDTFFTTKPSIRIKEINQLLQKYDLKKVAELIGIPYSTFTKEMRVGDYFYHQSDKQYYPFVRSEDERLKVDQKDESDELSFIKEHFDALKGLLQMYQSNRLLVLDGRIYSKEAKYENKSVKMNNDLYDEFKKFCEEYYPQYKIQDLICQSLLDFQSKYSR
ncbi:hypothetical protein [Ornithinibacillus contaminans]|uniref:hypothetical protein n=1 Tax=Ornithinibacillus contaminans TaxID=694055 RepID=UPI00064DE34A|nr:hypothetical protein [Ornithinibacillus contaminans]